MQAVGKLGSYISKSVVTVSGPFHPFGGAVDIVVVEQPDGGYKSSPWYVRFGKFQGVLKAKEKVVNISVNGVEADFYMFLDHTGEAYFLKEVDVEEGMSSLSPPSASGKVTNMRLGNRWPMKSKRYNYDADASGSILDCKNRNVMVRTNSHQSQILGLVFGRKSMKEGGIQHEVDGSGVVRINSLECAEIAADLLELKWSTNIASARSFEDNASLFSDEDKFKDEGDANNKFLDDGLLYIEKGIISHSGYKKRGNTAKEHDGEESCRTSVYVSETSTSVENVKEDAHVSNSETPTTTEILDFTKAFYHGSSEFNKSGIRSPDSQLSNSADKNNGSSKTSFENGIDRIQCFHYETCECSKVGLDGAAKQSNGTFSCEGWGGVCVNARTMHCTTELTSAVKSRRETNGLFGKEPLSLRECSGNEDRFSFSLDENNSETESTCLNCNKGNTATKSHHEVVLLQRSGDLVEEVEPLGGLTVSSFSNSTCTQEENRTCCKEDETNKYGSCSLLLPEPENSSRMVTIPIIPISEISVEEQLLFGDLDVSNFNEAKDRGTIHPNLEKESYLSLSPLVSDGVEESFLPKCSPTLYPYESAIDDTANDAKDSKNVQSGMDDNLRLPRAQSIAKDTEVLEELKLGPENPPLGTATISIDSLSRSRGSWSFSFKRSRGLQVSQPVTDGIEIHKKNIPKGTDDVKGEKNVVKLKVNKKKKKTLTPTSEQLASLNLKEGRNIVIFTFSTAMLGRQQVDARVYLWRWDTKIVISDVDGTITRSDLLGQVMPWVGMDWSQTGVAHLFSAIKENGYQFLFLSARSISQAYHTRQFLFNLKQNGKALPDGPVVISPDGLFPSLFREVFRRAPHEFKISCLEDIRALFPSDGNPFYAGFGNRDTDEISYLKVGIPTGKIFIINPKGEIVVNQQTHTKSYTSLCDLVHGMFPSMSSSEQEDFNQWNYWKLPPRCIDI